MTALLTSRDHLDVHGVRISAETTPLARAVAAVTRPAPLPERSADVECDPDLAGVLTAVPMGRCRTLHVRSDSGDLRGLEASLRDVGLLSPVIAHRVGRMIEVIDGERRLGAAQMAGWVTIPAVVLPHLPHDAALLLALHAGLGGSTRLPVRDKRAVVRELIHTYGHSPSALAGRLGLRPETVQRWMRDERRTERRHRSVRLAQVVALADRWDGEIRPDGLSHDQAHDLVGQLRALTAPRPTVIDIEGE